MPDNKVLSIVVPVYNEAATLTEVLDRILKSPLPEGIGKEIIVVDDCSRDATYELATDYARSHAEQRILVLRHEVNQGKGAALHSGIRQASGDFIIIQDADLEYDPAEYSKLLRPILDGVADVVYGSRFMGGSPHRLLLFWHYVGNKMLTTCCNMFTNLNMTDMETCYKLFKSEILKSLDLREKRFGFEPEVTIKMSRIPGIRVYEVGISYFGRTYSEGKKIGWRDGFRAIYCILRYGLFSRYRPASQS